MEYNLKHTKSSSTREALTAMYSFMKDERRNLIYAFLVMFTNSGLALLTPFLFGYTIDHFILVPDYKGLLIFCGIILALYLMSSFTEYYQTLVMGSIGQRMLFRLRNAVFHKIQSLPVSFFNQNKAGDLISRINQDTERVNQFFSQSLLQFVDSIFMMVVTAIFLLVIETRLGAAALSPGLFILMFVWLVTPWVRRKNAVAVQRSGGLSGEVQESLGNFKTIIAFNRRDFFRSKFEQANSANYNAALWSGLANGVFTPVFSLFSNLAQLIVLAFGIYLIANGNFTIGLLISYIAYTQHFYQPLRQLAALWAGFQTAMASWDRISVILNLKSDLHFSEKEVSSGSNGFPLLEFDNVSFQYPDGKPVLNDISFQLQAGKTYAFVGPTGGGKTTTASLMARLYDPIAGSIMLNGQPIDEYPAAALSQKIGFILQDPFLFNGTIKDNILYGHPEWKESSDEEIHSILKNKGLGVLIEKFEQGLATPISSVGENLSLGEKQIIAFIRAVLRQPDILILDEATANIDTITEKTLEKILEHLPQQTTKVVIAHRLNTIANADEIFFVNTGSVIPAGNFDQALDLLMKEARTS